MVGDMRWALGYILTAAAEMSALLTLEGAGVARGERELLNNLDLSVGKGDLIWIRGPNGSGKSTVLRAIAGFLSLSSGTIQRQDHPSEQIAYLGHRDGFEPRARLQPEAKFWLGSTTGLAGRLGIERLHGRRVHELSAGQLRRLEIERLLAMGRKLWLLDEPYASLDQDGVQALTALIRAHTDRGGAAIIVSHQGLPEFGREVKVLTIGAMA